MKNSIILSVLFLFTSYIGKSQCTTCDISTGGLTTDPVVSTTTVGQFVNLKFSYYNDAAGDLTASGTYPAGSVLIVLDLTSKFSFDSFVAPAGGDGDYFTWTYNAVDNTVEGINDQPIPDGVGDIDVKVKVKAIATSSGATPSLNVFMQDNSANDTSSDDGTVSINIASPLPVRLISFTGKATDNGNELTWKTANEQNFSHYEIEKSANAKSFKYIGKVESLSNTTENLTYNFLDENQVAGMVPGANSSLITYYSSLNYYRLKMVDLDGTSNYSNIIFIDNEAKHSIIGNFYPNPAISNEATIDITSAEHTNWTITSYDLSGKVLESDSRILEKGLNKVKIRFNKNYSGNLLYRFENGLETQYRKIVSQ